MVLIVTERIIHNLSTSKSSFTFNAHIHIHESWSFTMVSFILLYYCHLIYHQMNESVFIQYVSDAFGNRLYCVALCHNKIIHNITSKTFVIIWKQLQENGRLKARNTREVSVYNVLDCSLGSNTFVLFCSMNFFA